MADNHWTATFLVRPEDRKAWQLPEEMDKIPSGPENTLTTSSRHNWVMSELRSLAEKPGFSALGWLNTSGPTSRQVEGNEWIFSEVAVDELPASLQAFEAAVHLAETNPNYFGIRNEDLRHAFEEDSRKTATDLEIPRHGDGDDPEYVVSVILGFRRLLKLAIANKLQIVHFIQIV